MKTMLLSLAFATMSCLGASARSDEWVLQTIYPPQGQAIQIYKRVAARDSVALYHHGRGMGTRCETTKQCDSSVETTRTANGHPVSYTR